VSHRTVAWLVIGAAVTLDGVLGLLFGRVEHIPEWHGLFCGLANGVTDGCDIPPSTGWGYGITAIEYVTVVPLLAASFSLFSAWLSGKHAHAAKREILAELRKDSDDCGSPASSDVERSDEVGGADQRRRHG
jgi:hypothetical protein